MEIPGNADELNLPVLPLLPSSAAVFFRVAAPTLDLYIGGVPLEGGLGRFFLHDEPNADKTLAELYNVQPALVIPREHWPHSPLRVPNEEINYARALNDEFRDVDRWPGFPDDKAWGNHLGDTHRFLRELSEKKWMSNFAAMPMLKILTRGIEHVVGIPDNVVVVTMDTSTRMTNLIMNKEQASTAFWKCPTNDQVVAGGDGMFNRPLHARWFNRRLYAGLINFTKENGEGFHWASFVWDRKTGNLLISDNWTKNRLQRVRAFVRFWRQTLYCNDYPYPFTFVLLPGLPQTRNWECGYIALMNLWHLLRGLTGERLEDIQTSELGFSVQKDKTFTDNPPVSDMSEWRLRDWPFYEADKSQDKYADLLNLSLDFLRNVAANELGIRTGDEFRLGTKDGKALWDFRGLEAYFDINGPKFPLRWNSTLTTLGGPCVLLPGYAKATYAHHRVVPKRSQGDPTVVDLYHPVRFIQDHRGVENIEPRLSTDVVNARKGRKDAYDKARALIVAEQDERVPYDLTSQKSRSPSVSRHSSPAARAPSSHHRTPSRELPRETTPGRRQSVPTTPQRDQAVAMSPGSQGRPSRLGSVEGTPVQTQLGPKMRALQTDSPLVQDISMSPPPASERHRTPTSPLVPRSGKFLIPRPASPLISQEASPFVSRGSTPARGPSESIASVLESPAARDQMDPVTTPVSRHSMTTRSRQVQPAGPSMPSVQENSPELLRQLTQSRSGGLSSFDSPLSSITGSIRPPSHLLSSGYPSSQSGSELEDEFFHFSRVEGEIPVRNDYTGVLSMREGGQQMTTHLMTLLRPLFNARRVVPHVEFDGSYTSMTPPGLINKDAWQWLEGQLAPFTGATETGQQRESRAERAARREAAKAGERELSE